MATNRQVRAMLNAVAKKRFNKSYKALSSKRALTIRRIAARIVRRGR